MSNQSKPVVQMGPDINDIRAAAARGGGGPVVQSPPSATQIQDPTRPTPQRSAHRPPAPPQGGVGSALPVNREVDGLSKSTVEGLAAIQEANRREAEAAIEAEEKKRIESGEAVVSDEVDKLAQLGSIDVEGLRYLLQDNPLLQPGIRESIEKDLEEISLADLVLRNRGKQRVYILGDELYVDLQTVTGREDLIVKRLLREDAGQLDIYFEDKKALLNMAIGIEAINGNPLPALEDPAQGKATEKTILRRYEAISELPIQLIGFLAINYAWFDLRVKRRFTSRSVKNG